MADWAIGGASPLSYSILSRLTNRRMKVSLKACLGMEALNRAIWLWHAKGREAAWKELGPHTGYRVEDEWLNESVWLPVPDQPKHPLDLGDFVDVLVGRLELPYLGSRLLLPHDINRTAQQLPALLDATIVAAGLSPMVGMRQLLAAYPAADEDRRQRFRSVILGELQLTRDELQEELLALSEAIRVMRDLPLGSYGPAELLAELLAMSQS